MKAAAGPVLVALLLAWMSPAAAAPTPATDARAGVIAVKTSFDASPSVALSPAAAVAKFDTRPLPGLFEQESPAFLVGVALLLGVARVAKALLDRRLRLAKACAVPRRGATGRRGIAPRSAGVPAA